MNIPRRVQTLDRHDKCFFFEKKTVWCVHDALYVYDPQVQGNWQRAISDHLGQFSSLRSLALTADEQLLLVVTGKRSRVLVLRTADGTLVRQLTGPHGMLLIPVGVALVPSTGEVLISDMGRMQVVRFQSIDNDTVVGTLGDSDTLRLGPGLAVLDGSNCPSVRRCFILLLCQVFTHLIMPLFLTGGSLRRYD